MEKNLCRSQAKAFRRHRGTANKRPAFAEFGDAKLSARPSSGQLRESLQGRARSEPECPCRFERIH